jgi:nitrite reductase/ring-hydroxylating ferredoxin subunit
MPAVPQAETQAEVGEQDTAYAVCHVRDIPNRRARSFSLLRLEPAAAEKGEQPDVEVPFHIVIVRWDRKLHAYVNQCPHHGSQLDWEQNQFMDPSGTRLMCGKHGATFAVDTGACIEGPCRNAALQPVRLAILDGDICVVGVRLADAA